MPPLNREVILRSSVNLARHVDAVIVASTDNWHSLHAIHACRAGKDVYVEKPLSQSIGEGRAAVEAAAKYDRVAQFGTQQRSWEHYHKAVEVIQSGRLGEISEVKVWDCQWAARSTGTASASR